MGKSTQTPEREYISLFAGLPVLLPLGTWRFEHWKKVGTWADNTNRTIHGQTMKASTYLYTYNKDRRIDEKRNSPMHYPNAYPDQSVPTVAFNLYGPGPGDWHMIDYM